MRCLPLILAVLLAALATAAQAQATRPAAPGRGQPEAKAPEKPQSPAEKEAERLVGISKWARDTGAGREQVLARVFGPIVAGNASDYDKNRTMAASLNQQAEAAGKDGNAVAARKYRALSDLFAECAKENRDFVTAYKAGNMRAAKEALMKLRAYDDRIAQLAGQRVARSWYAHETMVATMDMTGEEIKRGFEQQFLGRGPAPTGTPAPSSPASRNR